MKQPQIIWLASAQRPKKWRSTDKIPIPERVDSSKAASKALYLTAALYMISRMEWTGALTVPGNLKTGAVFAVDLRWMILQITIMIQKSKTP
jgi:hypothetical protein